MGSKRRSAAGLGGREGSWYERDLGQVRPYLYVGSRRIAEEGSGLVELGIRTIVNVRQENINIRGPRPSEHTLRILKVGLSDASDADLLSELVGAVRQVCEAEKPVLVACRAGVSRSVALVVAFLMAQERIPFHQALDVVRLVRKQASPRHSFVEQLQMFHIMGLGTVLPDASLHPFYRMFLLRKWVLKRLRSVDPSRRASREGVVFGGFGVGVGRLPCGVPEEWPAWAVQPRPPLEEVHWLALPDPAPEAEAEAAVRCGKCLAAVLPSEALLPHDEATRPTLYNDECGGPDLPSPYVPSADRPVWRTFDCPVAESRVYVVPTRSLLGQASALEGRLLCPACRARLGTYSWSLGRCSEPDRDVWLSCRRPVFPAFRLALHALLLPSHHPLVQEHHIPHDLIAL